MMGATMDDPMMDLTTYIILCGIFDQLFYVWVSG